MADGASYQISVDASTNGVESASSQLTNLASQLESAGAKSTAAADAVAMSQAKYNQMEMAATKAAKAVEKVTLAGGDTSALQSAADAATAALQAQASALDELKSAASAASAEEKRLGAALKSAEKASADAGREFEAGKVALKDLGKKAAGPAGEWIEKLSGAMGLISNPAAAMAAGAAVITIAFVAMSTAAIMGVFAIAKMAVQLNKAAKVKFDNIGKKAQENFAKLFSGVKIDKFLDAYKDVTSLLDESSSSAQAVKLILETMLNPLFDGAAAIGPYVKELFRGMVLGAILLAIVVVLAKNALMKMIPDGLLSNIDWMKTALNAGVIAMFVLAAAVVVVTVAFGVLITALVVGAAIGIMSLLAVPIAFLLIVAAVVYVGYVIGEFISSALAYFADLASGAIGYLSGMASGAMEAGSQIIAGLLSSISSGSGAVFDALKNLGSGAMGALKSALGIASPSKVAIALMTNVTETSAATIDKGASSVQSAMESMVEPTDMPRVDQDAPGGKRPVASAGTSSKGLVLSGTYNFYGVKDASDAEAKFSAMLTRLLEGDVLSLGGEVAV